MKLALSSGDHESGSDHQHHGADGGRNFFTLMGLNPDVDITRLDAMIFRVWKRHEERQNSQDCRPQAPLQIEPSLEASCSES